MRKVIFFGILAAFLGGFSAFFWYEGGGVNNASLAQETKLSAVSPGKTTGSLPSGQVNSADLQGLTPDEQVNVLVYQYANRSVVNINTKGIQSDQFQLFRVLAEGEGYTGSMKLDHDFRVKVV
jgi:hypothetical protein